MVVEEGDAEDSAFLSLLQTLRAHVDSSNSSEEEITDTAYLLQLFEDQRIQNLVSIYNKLSRFDRHSTHIPLDCNTYHLSEDICNQLISEWINEAQDLYQLLTTPHFKALLIANDFIAQRSYTPSLSVDTDESYSSNQSTADAEGDSIKIVQVIKNKEPLGATVSIDENGVVTIARVIYGGAAHRSGLIQVGDQIYEVNGIVLRGISPLEVVTILEQECRSYSISFKLIPGEYGGYLKTDPQESRVRVKSHFDYAPYNDTYHPCPQAGITFKKGDILHIVNQDDSNWWQARKEPNIFYNNYLYPPGCRAGIIPGKQLQERRFAALRDSRSFGGSVRYVEILSSFKSPFSKALWRTRKVKKIMYKASENEEFDRGTIATYDEVVRFYPQEGTYRPIVLIGPPGVGRNELVRHLVGLNPDFYKRPVPHTTRPSKDWESDGIHYYFISEDFAQLEVTQGNFVEYGSYQGHFYGTHIGEIECIINQGCVCVYNPLPQTLKKIYTPKLKPFVIFVKPPFDFELLRRTRNQVNARSTDILSPGTRTFTDQEFKEMIINAHKIEYLYGHYFDYTLTNGVLEEAFEKLVEIVKIVELEPLWVPANWAS